MGTGPGSSSQGLHGARATWGQTLVPNIDPPSEGGWRTELYGPIAIQLVLACKGRFALPVLTYQMYAAVRFSKTAIFGLARAECL